jgi:hypothetical protein
MKFTVTWSPVASARLARLWLRSANRQAIRSAADSIDAQLKHDPDQVGESRSGSRRIIHQPPLGVVFSVNTGDRTVLVLDVWQYFSRSK